jgi:hypothetical protein
MRATTGNITYRRFVTVHYPSRGLDEAVVEIIGRPKLSLANLTLTFDGIVVPSTLYDFDAATEEGEYTGAAGSITPGGVPVPTNFTIVINSETVPAGTSIYAVGSWDFVSARSPTISNTSWPTRRSPRATCGPRAAPPRRAPRARWSPMPAIVSGCARARARRPRPGRPTPRSPPRCPSAPMDPTPADPTGLTAPFSGIYGADTPAWTTGAANVYRTELYRGPTTTFADASLIFTSFLGPSTSTFYADTGGLTPNTIGCAATTRSARHRT